MAKKKLTNRNGYWSKRVNGKTHYFGKDEAEAHEKWKSQEPFLRSGMEVPTDDGGPTLADLLNEFLSDRLQTVELGMMVKPTDDGYVYVCDRIATAIPKNTRLRSLTPAHFANVRKVLVVGKRKKRICLKSHDRWLGYARAVLRFASIDEFLIKGQLPFTPALACIPKREMRR